MNNRVLERRVKAGATLLDRVRPGWAHEIALDRLAMESCDRCILGQLWGAYLEGFQALLMPLPAFELFSAAALGFTLFDSEQCYADLWRVQARFTALTDAWLGAIRERIGESPEVLHE